MGQLTGTLILNQSISPSRLFLNTTVLPQTAHTSLQHDLWGFRQRKITPARLNGWMAFFRNSLGIYKDSPLGQRALLNLVEIAQKIVGVSTDHAKDQKKLFDLIREWKKLLDQEQRGEQVLKEAGLLEILPVICKANKRKITEAGGIAAWDVLSATDQAEHNAEAHRQVCIWLGERAFDGLSAEEK